MQDKMQAERLGFAKWQADRSLRPLLGRVARVGVVTLVMTSVMATAWSVPTYAASAPLKGSAALPVAAQQASAPQDSNLGVLIVAVDEAGPAAQAGIVRGDILLTANAIAINSTAALYEVVVNAAPGDTVTLAIQHGDDVRTVMVTLGQIDERAYLGVQVVDPPNTVEMAPTPDVQVAPEVGVGAVTATDVVSDVVILGLPMVVAEVLPDSPAAQAGIVAGDLILAIDGVPLAVPEDLMLALQGRIPGEVVNLTVQKGGPSGAAVVEMPVTLGAAPDDVARPYLGLRFTGGPQPVMIESAPAAGAYAAPALPPPPMLMPGYAYPGVVGGASCGAGNVTIQQFFYLPSNALPYGAPYDVPYTVPYSVPLSPHIPAQPVMPPVPFFIHGVGANPETFAYAATDVEKNVIFWQGQVGEEIGATVYAVPATGAAVASPSLPAQGGDVVIVRKLVQPLMEGAPVVGHATVVMDEEVVAPSAVPVVPPVGEWY